MPMTIIWVSYAAIVVSWVVALLFFMQPLEAVLNNKLKVGDDLEFPTDHYFVAASLMLLPLGLFLARSREQLRSFSEGSVLLEKSEVLLIAVTGGILLLSWFYTPLQDLYREDGFFENMTAFLAISAGVILLVTIRSVKARKTRYLVFALSLCCLTFGFEEISWGQRIFGFETPEAIKETNYQEEFNLHNFLNPYFPFLYPIFNLFVCGFFLSNKRAGRFLPQELRGLFQPRNAEIFAVIFLGLSVDSY
jgi:hypothetical protein